MLQLTVMEDLSLSSIDVGQPGKANDAMVFKMSDLWVPSGARVEHLIARPLVITSLEMELIRARVTS